MFVILLSYNLGGSFGLFCQPITEKKIIQTSIFFDGGSWYIDQDQADELKNLLDMIEDVTNYQISIYGHTDDIGSRVYNQWLSRMRSQAVLEEIANHAIPKEYIRIESHGMENPLFDNKKWEGKVLNRRVDILFEPIVF